MAEDAAREVPCGDDGVGVAELLVEQLRTGVDRLRGVDVEQEAPPGLAHLYLGMHDVSQYQDASRAGVVVDEQAGVPRGVSRCGHGADAGNHVLPGSEELDHLCEWLLHRFGVRADDLVGAVPVVPLGPVSNVPREGQQSGQLTSAFLRERSKQPATFRELLAF